MENVLIPILVGIIPILVGIIHFVKHIPGNMD